MTPTPRQTDALNHVADKLWDKYQHDVMPPFAELEYEARVILWTYIHDADEQGDPVEPLDLRLEHDGHGHITITGVVVQ